MTGGGSCWGAGRRVVRAVGAVVAVGAAGVALQSVPGASEPVARGATVKKPVVRPQLIVAPRGNDATCRRNKLKRPCASFDRAYALSRLGDVVHVLGGAYPFQRLTAKRGKKLDVDAPNVIIQPAPGASVTVAGLELAGDDTQSGPSHVTVRGFRDSRSPQGAVEVEGAFDVRLENIDAANFRIDHSSNVTVRGGDWGPCTVPSSTCSNSKIDVDAGANIVVEHARFHDYRIVPNSGEHFECMIVFGGRNVTIRGNTFTNCEFYNIFIQHPTWADGYNGRTPEGMVIERNSFSPVWENGVWNVRFSALAFSPRRIPFRNVVVRCNEFRGGSKMEINDDSDGTRYEAFTVTKQC